MATISSLAGALQLTGEAVRQQLLQLQRDGWVEATLERSADRARTGRPATVYRLTPAGDHLFHKAYDELSIALIDAVAEEYGADAARRVLARVSDDRVRALQPSMHGLTLEQRVESLKNWYLPEDPHMELAHTNGDLLLIERNCPYYNAAMRRPALCSVSVSSLSRLLGVRVAREEKFQNGDGRCVFRIFANEPVESDEFQLER